MEDVLANIEIKMLGKKVNFSLLNNMVCAVDAANKVKITTTGEAPHAPQGASSAQMAVPVRGQDAGDNLFAALGEHWGTLLVHCT